MDPWKGLLTTNEVLYNFWNIVLFKRNSVSVSMEWYHLRLQRLELSGIEPGY
jgi:hypothetical protein